MTRNSRKKKAEADLRRNRDSRNSLGQKPKDNVENVEEEEMGNSEGEVIEIREDRRVIRKPVRYRDESEERILDNHSSETQVESENRPYQEEHEKEEEIQTLRENVRNLEGNLRTLEGKFENLTKELGKEMKDLGKTVDQTNNSMTNAMSLVLEKLETLTNRPDTSDNTSTLLISNDQDINMENRPNQREERSLERENQHDQVRHRDLRNQEESQQSNHLENDVREPPSPCQRPIYTSQEDQNDNQGYEYNSRPEFVSQIQTNPSYDRQVRNSRYPYPESEMDEWDGNPRAPIRDICIAPRGEKPMSPIRSRGQDTHNTTVARSTFSKPDNYDGKTSWTEYLAHFNLVSTINQWSTEVKALRLASCMTGPARSILGDLKEEHLADFDRLVPVLTAKFEPKNQCEMYRVQVEARVRKNKEPLVAMAQDVKRLVRLGYPTAPSEVRDSLGYKYFRDALNDREMEWAVCQGSGENVDEALNLALKYEAFKAGQNKGRSERLNLRQCTMVEEEETTPDLTQIVKENVEQIEYLLRRMEATEDKEKNENKQSKYTQGQNDRNCFKCNKPGHRAVDCRAGITCYNCQKLGHYARDCRKNRSHGHRNMSQGQGQRQGQRFQGQGQRYQSQGWSGEEARQTESLPLNQ